jgi:hypothetical protein
MNTSHSRIASRLSLVALTAAAALLAIPAAQGAIFKFGSKLNNTVQPSNAGTAHKCSDSHPSWKCTWVMNEAYGRPDGGEKSPKDGKITQIRLIAGEAGSFRLQIVRTRKVDNDTYKAKVVRQGPTIHYTGQPDPDEPYKVETFSVNITIKKGERLAIRTGKTSTLRCSSGGPNTLMYHPPLEPGAAFRANGLDDGCWMLIEAVAKTGSGRVSLADR